MDDGSPPRSRTLLALYLVLGLAAFTPVLFIGFVADDWEFMKIVTSAKSVLVCFAPLVGRFVRPWVVLTYYANYRLFGFWTFPYHLTVVLLHIVNAWLVAKLAARLDESGNAILPMASGLLFLLFAGHTEAVSWVAGVADPALTPFLIGALLCFAAVLDAPRPLPSMLAGWSLFVGAMLAKETSVVFPALVVVFAAASLGRGRGTSRIVWRTVVFLTVPVLLVVSYFVFRARVFGAPVSAYGGLGTSSGLAMLVREMRAFLLRAFLPPLSPITRAWIVGLDVVLFAAGLIVLAAAARAWPRTRRALIFTAIAVPIALAPALPLTISIATSESERYVYLASAFSSIFIAAILTTWRRRAAGVTIFALLLVVHTFYLERANRNWRDASRVFAGIVDSFSDVVQKQRVAPGSLVLILNLPDNIRGAYVFRNGFMSAIALRRPEAAAFLSRTRFVASQNMRTVNDAPAVVRTDARTFDVDIWPNMFLQEAAPATVHYEFPQWSPTHYVVRLNANVWNAAILAAAGTHLVTAAMLEGEGAPFGVIDVPAEPALCNGPTLRFSGWALDDTDLTKVEIVRDPLGAEAPASHPSLGEAQRRVNTRPDVVAAYPDFPYTDRAEWNYYLPCAAVESAPGKTLHVRVIASDSHGHRAEIGSRSVRSR